MILAYGANNYHSFYEGFEISLRLPKSTPYEISDGKSYTNVLCVKGANSSGKTTVLRALSFLNFFCCYSFSMLEPDEELPFEPFVGNENNSSFFMEFMVNNIEYRYELETTQKEIISEEIFRKKNRWKSVIRREKNQIVERVNDFKDVEIIQLRSNASIISSSNKYNEVSSLDDIYEFFLNMMTNVSLLNRIPKKADLNNVNRIYYENSEVFSFVKDIVRKFDLGIQDIVIEIRLDENDEDVYMPYFIHKTNNSEFRLPYSKESSGTKSLYSQLLQYFFTLNLSGILIMDEFDINLHPDILPHLVNLFTDPDINSNNSQLLFTTHSSNILDEMGKYRTVLVNKDDNQSFAYRLDEIPGDMIRNDRSLEKVYKTGKIGGVPRI